VRPIAFIAPIVPKAKGRPRIVRRGKHAIQAATPAETRRWEASFAAIAAPFTPVPPIDEPIEVSMLFVLPRPQKLMRKADPDGLLPASGRPDVDNLVKAVMDALKAWWADDARVVSLRARKAYAERDGGPRVEVAIRSAPGFEEAPHAWSETPTTPAPATAPVAPSSRSAVRDAGAKAVAKKRRRDGVDSARSAAADLGAVPVAAGAVRRRR